MKGQRLQNFWDAFSDTEKMEIEARYREQKTEYLTLQELRRELELTQTDIAERLDVRQENISNIERRKDIKLSTLEEYIAAMGASLKIVVEFPNRPPVTLKSFGEQKPPEKQGLNPQSGLT